MQKYRIDANDANKMPRLEGGSVNRYPLSNASEGGANPACENESCIVGQGWRGRFSRSIRGVVGSYGVRVREQSRQRVEHRKPSPTLTVPLATTRETRLGVDQTKNGTKRRNARTTSLFCDNERQKKQACLNSRSSHTHVDENVLWRADEKSVTLTDPVLKSWSKNASLGQESPPTCGVIDHNTVQRCFREQAPVRVALSS